VPVVVANFCMRTRRDETRRWESPGIVSLIQVSDQAVGSRTRLPFLSWEKHHIFSVRFRMVIMRWYCLNSEIFPDLDYLSTHPSIQVTGKRKIVIQFQTFVDCAFSSHVAMCLTCPCTQLYALHLNSLPRSTV